MIDKSKHACRARLLDRQAERSFWWGKLMMIIGVIFYLTLTQ